MPILLFRNVLVFLFDPTVFWAEKAVIGVYITSAYARLYSKCNSVFRANEIVPFTPRRQIHGNGGL